MCYSSYWSVFIKVTFFHLVHGKRQKTRSKIEPKMNKFLVQTRLAFAKKKNQTFKISAKISGMTRKIYWTSLTGDLLDKIHFLISLNWVFLPTRVSEYTMKEIFTVQNRMKNYLLLVSKSALKLNYFPLRPGESLIYGISVSTSLNKSSTFYVFKGYFFLLCNF